MITRNMQILYKLFILLALLIVAGCGADNSQQSASEGTITANLAWSPTGKATAKTVASAPVGVTTVRIIISATGMTTIQKDFSATSGSGTITGVLSGTARTLTAQGLDGAGTVIYQGTAANLTVQAGQTTNAGTITMAAVGVTTYSVSGTITSGGAAFVGVTVTMTGNNVPATTVSSGNYSFSGAQNGSYMLTPSKTGYTFSPLSQSVTINGANVTGKNFTATTSAANTYSISGTITAGGSALPGVAVITNGGSGSTNSNGNYAISSLPSASYTLTPSRIGYTFTPESQSVSVNGGNLTGKNFTATASSNGTTTGTIQIPKTGQTVSYTDGDDGALRQGVAWPSPRFIDNANGTVTDNLTGLIWLKNANCFNTQNWIIALTSANVLASGACGLSDGSTAGQWRLPNIIELESLVDISRFNPALPTGHPFTSAQGNYWSSSNVAYFTSYGYDAWVVDIDDGGVGGSSKNHGSYYVWPVRAGQ